jgi:hypothetical protein
MLSDDEDDMPLASQPSLNGNMKNGHVSTNGAASSKGRVLDADGDTPMSDPDDDDVPLVRIWPRACTGSLRANSHFILLLVSGDALRNVHSLQAQTPCCTCVGFQ